MKQLLEYINIKKWQKVDYVLTLDYYLAKLISKKTNFKVLDIIVWEAKKDKDEFNYFKFQYQGKYYELYNDSLKQIKIKE